MSKIRKITRLFRSYRIAGLKFSCRVYGWLISSFRFAVDKVYIWFYPPVRVTLELATNRDDAFWHVSFSASERLSHLARRAGIPSIATTFARAQWVGMTVDARRVRPAIGNIDQLDTLPFLYSLSPRVRKIYSNTFNRVLRRLFLRPNLRINLAKCAQGVDCGLDS